MAITQEYKYFKPASIDETLALLAEFKNSAILAGGTDLIVNLKEGIATPDAVIDIKGLDDFKKIEFRDNRLIVGALVTFAELLESKVVKNKFPLVMETCNTVGSMGVRNRATMVGNICSAVPSLDSGPLLSVYEAEVFVKSSSSERKIAVSNWFVGPKETSLKNGELVTGISIPFPAKKHAGCYVRLGRYWGEDLAQVGVSILAFSDNSYRIAFGAVAPVPIRAKKIEALLNGRQLDNSLIDRAKKVVPDEISPITDIRSSKEYRLHVANVMLERGLNAAYSRLNGGGPEYGTNLLA